MLLQLQRYDLHVKYTPGKDVLIADSLSHAVAIGQVHMDMEDLYSEVIYDIQAMDTLSADMLQCLKVATQQDNMLQAVIRVHNQGWPARKRHLDSTFIGTGH
ncbi:macrophage-expressed gene 1 protein-like [Labeo rohita]|uniref:Macrophage-expressed gene 1 protein-like n=1 Tax=Labeo rohita TaxID=84645 RepID=A0A498LK11_LABRO|nr:macrophage-expressed gene 1 protein-like [Labeo rohita]